MKKQIVAGCLMAGQLAITVAASAETPCDLLRAEYQALAEQHPAATEDNGDGRFFNAVIGPKIVALPRGTDCKSFGTWLREQGLDSGIADDLEADPKETMICDTWPRLYDHRRDGGFIALAGMQGSAHCTVVQVIDVEGDRLRMGSGSSDCAPSSFEVVRIAGRAYPAMLRPKIYGADLSYRLDLISVDPGIDAAFCSLSINYVPEFIGRWFGPKGENDVDPEIRRVIEPILSDLASGRDPQPRIKPWLDRPQGDGPYDLAISGYPERAIKGMRYPNTGDHVYSLPWGVPYLGGKYAQNGWYSNYGSLSEDAAIPLVIAGRRLLLIFGYCYTPGTPPPDAGFGLYEYNDQRRDFDAIAGGVIERHGINPRIE